MRSKIYMSGGELLCGLKILSKRAKKFLKRAKRAEKILKILSSKSHQKLIFLMEICDFFRFKSAKFFLKFKTLVFF